MQGLTAAPSGSWVCWFCETITPLDEMGYQPGKLCPECWAAINRGTLTPQRLVNELVSQLAERPWRDGWWSARVVEVLAGEIFLLQNLARCGWQPEDEDDLPF